MSDEQPPIITQPTGKLELESSNDPPGLECLSPGLECLSGVGHLFVKQKVELLEALTGFEKNNTFQIFDNTGHELFIAKEETDCCTRNCCGTNRPFDMTIKDTNGIEVIHLYRPLACFACCFPSCRPSIDIYAPPGNNVGRVEQEWTCINQRFKIKDAAGNIALRIQGPCCTMSCCGSDVEFQVLSADGAVEVGKISKKWSGVAREAFTDADNFGISFPADLDNRMKAVMIGACMLIDFMYFETS